MKNIFSGIQGTSWRRSKFDLSHEKKLSFDMGELIPTLCQEVLPGDSWRVSSEIFLRMQALLSPFMHRVDVTTHYFFVPTRLLWSEWEDFITGGRTGNVLPIAPYIELDNVIKSRFATGTLPDYMGLPDMSTQTYGATPVRVSALPFRAYQLIYDEYYRDNTLTPPIDCPLTSGPQGGTPVLDQHLNLRFRAWEKDYFTSARPQAQLGGDTLIPTSNNISYRVQSKVVRTDGLDPAPNSLIGVDGTVTGNNMTVSKASAAGAGSAGRIENIQQIDTNITINNLRRALSLQKFLEAMMRGGSRYSEFIRNIFGETPPDERLMRPEYLGGGKQRVQVNDVLQTAQGTNPVGTMNGMAYSVGNSNRFSRSFNEHGYILALTSVTPKPAYQQGIPRMYFRDTKFDYMMPQFAEIGEQEIRNKEIYVDPTSATTLDGTWGYQQRYAEYKYIPDSVHGDLRSTLSFWHAGQIYTAFPPLNTNFIECKPTKRIFAVQGSTDNLIAQVYHKVDALRKMPYYSTPNM